MSLKPHKESKHYRTNKISMANKEIKNWKDRTSKGKEIFVASKVKTIHPVVDKIVCRLLEIDRIQYIRVSQTDLYASSEIQIRGRIKTPISTPSHPSAIGVHLILDHPYNTIQFYEITSAVKGYGEKMVKAVLSSIPADWLAAVIIDYDSESFWDRMIEKYDNLSII